jgi:hypothetical protein
MLVMLTLMYPIDGDDEVIASWTVEAASCRHVERGIEERLAAGLRRHGRNLTIARLDGLQRFDPRQLRIEVEEWPVWSLADIAQEVGEEPPAIVSRTRAQRSVPRTLGEVLARHGVWQGRRRAPRGGR